MLPVMYLLCLQWRLIISTFQLEFAERVTYIEELMFSEIGIVLNYEENYFCIVHRMYRPLTSFNMRLTSFNLTLPLISILSICFV